MWAKRPQRLLPLLALPTCARALCASPQLAAVVRDARAQAETLIGDASLPFSVLWRPEQARALLELHDTFIFDCDGVLWSGALGLLPEAKQTLELLARRGKRCLFVTNNSARSRAAYAEKFAGLGLDARAEQVVPSSFVAARWLRRAAPSLERALVIGESGVEEELRAVGIDVVRTAAGAFDERAFASALPEPRVGAVVVGSDTTFSFASLAAASLHLDPQLNAGCLFVATNADGYDVVGGRRVPGNGCLVAAVAAACGRQPDAVCGKPSAELGEYLTASVADGGLGVDPTRAIVIGDRLDTDVALADAIGAHSLLVLTGVASARDAASCPPGPSCPDAVASHLGALLLGEV